MTMLTIQAPPDIPLKVLHYRLAQLGFAVIQSAPPIQNEAPAKKQAKPKKAKPEREYRSLVVTKREVIEGKTVETTREIDGVTVENEIAKMMRLICFRPRDMRVITKFPTASRIKKLVDDGMEVRALTEWYVAHMDSAWGLKPTEYAYCEPQTEETKP